MWLESDSEAIPVPGKKYYKVNSLYVLVTDTPVSVHSDDRIDSCNGDDVDQLALDSDSEVIPVQNKEWFKIIYCVYIFVTDTPVSVHSEDSMDSCNGDYVDQLALDSDYEVIPVPGLK